MAAALQVQAGSCATVGSSAAARSGGGNEARPRALAAVIASPAQSKQRELRLRSCGVRPLPPVGADENPCPLRLPPPARGSVVLASLAHGLQLLSGLSHGHHGLRQLLRRLLVVVYDCLIQGVTAGLAHLRGEHIKASAEGTLKLVAVATSGPTISELPSWPTASAA